MIGIPVVVNLYLSMIIHFILLVIPIQFRLNNSNKFMFTILILMFDLLNFSVKL